MRAPSAEMHPVQTSAKSVLMISNNAASIGNDDIVLEEAELDLFREPDSFRPKTPPPSYTTYLRIPDHVQQGTPSRFELRLIRPHSLWAHMLWNAGIVLARFLDHHKAKCLNKTVLELGAAAALPTFVAAINGCKLAVATDYPEQYLIENIEYNTRVNLPAYLDKGVIKVMGHLWGDHVEPLLSELKPFTASHSEIPKFDLVILADVVFNHSQHTQLLKTVKSTLCPHNGIAYVSFSHHKPHLAHKDLHFFELAQQEPFNFKVTKLFEEKLKPMFEVDRGDPAVRATVHVYTMQL
ncbi:hypothetical protein SeMB42_g05488 [Synchytrium endobioticum]|uniref:Elongation factor methyltransferase 7 n=1 Tax=Synchytrium endobioticum TaxID=286115 RepID=A0A507CR51_9FUNG|nr:hypothetical protein SeMB42_g05488 [Synchytrium endobioticum]TPX43535.1 hypothetical protein SeLEV6574_g05008 [Synchytrium endobioticum]